LLGCGIDLGTSGCRLALVDSAGLVNQLSCHYPGPFRQAESWREGVKQLLAQLPEPQRQGIGAIAIDGTSGTLLACSSKGDPLAAALAYNDACPEQAEQARQLVPAGGSAASSSGSVARGLQLLDRLKLQPGSDLILRHQADWLMGWLLGDWRWGEEGNNLRLGWDLLQNQWSGGISHSSWATALPRVLPSGRLVGPIGAAAAAALKLPMDCQIISGSTDANAAVLAAEPQEGDGVAVLGTTLVLKQFAPAPLHGPGVNNHRIAGRWLVGGASNAGGGVLRQFFSEQQLEELSRQIQPEISTGLNLFPLPQRGERFPVDDPQLEPVLKPRPVSDALYLQALLEGLSTIECQGWQRLEELGAPAVQRVLSVGGGANNPQWRALRQKLLNKPVLNRSKASPAAAMARLARQTVTLEQSSG
jgi:sugar (pentulose or hexulose) kinase